MKRLNLFLGAFALVAVLSALSYSVFAQDNSNRDHYGRILRGPYETNRFADNWFIGLGGGTNFLWSQDYKMVMAPSIDASIGKWFTPSIGMSLGYQGFKTSYQTLTYSSAQSLGYMYIHGEFLWNISNAFSGYKESRFWNFVPYLHAGYFRSYGLSNDDFVENNIAAGAGLLHNLRLADRLDLIINMRAAIMDGDAVKSSNVSIMTSVTAGLALDLGWNSFIRTSKLFSEAEMCYSESLAVLETANLALQQANSQLEQNNDKLALKNKQLISELHELKAEVTPEDDYSYMYMNMMPAVYFEIGKTILSDLELKHLDFIVNEIIYKLDRESQIFITIIGSADRNTGSCRRNQYLSKARAEYVLEILVDKYDIDPNRIVLMSEVVDAENAPAYSRAVTFSF